MAPGTDPAAPAPGSPTRPAWRPAPTRPPPRPGCPTRPATPVPGTQAQDLLPHPAPAPGDVTPGVPAAPVDVADANLAADGMPGTPGDVVEVAAYGVEESTWPDPKPDRPEPAPAAGARSDLPAAAHPSRRGRRPARRREPRARRADRRHPRRRRRRPPRASHHHHHHHDRDRDSEAPAGFVEIDAPDLQTAADALRRWSAELQSIAAGLGTVRAGMGISSIQPMVDETVGRQCGELDAIAAELLGEATELDMRAQLASDELGDVAPQAAPAPAPGSAEAELVAGDDAAKPGGIFGRILGALTGDGDDKHRA